MSFKRIPAINENPNQIGILSGLVLNVKAAPYNCKGDGVTDDTAGIQQAINDAFAKGDSYFPTVYFPPGIYMISSPIHHDQSGNYAKIQGAGKRETRIKASVAMTSLLILGQSGNSFDGQKRMDGITFDGNFLVDTLVDASQLAYSTIQNCEFVHMKSGGWAIQIGKWVNRILNNIFNGFDNTMTNPLGNGILVPSASSPINNLVIENNSFTSCVIGVQNDAGSNDFTIVKNNFDTCSGTAIWLTNGAYNTKIKDNYIEACGKTGVSVQKAASTYQTWNASIVIHTKYSVEWTEANMYKNLIIQGNQFANVAPTVIALSHVASMHIYDNQCLENYNYTYFVELKWHGVYKGFAKRNIIEHQGGSSQFTQLVGLNTDTDNLYQTQSGLIIRDYSTTTIGRFIEGFNVFGNPINWTTNGTLSIGKDGTFEGVQPIWKFQGTGYQSILLNTDSSNFSQLKGQYFRVNYLSKGSGTATNGIRFSIAINTGGGDTVIYDHSPSNTAWTNDQQFTFYVPTNATDVKMTLQVVDNTNPTWLTKFDVVHASVDLTTHKYDKSNLKLAATPTFGTWGVGDVVENSTPAASGFMGWVCVTAGSPGTWKGYGAIQA